MSCSMSLDEDTIRMIEEKRLKALELRASRAQAAQSVPAPEIPPTDANIESDKEENAADNATSTVTTAVNTEEPCTTCGLKKINKLYLEIYSEKVCTDCIKSSDEYTQVTKQDAMAEFLLSDYSLKSLPHQLKSNPHRRGWCEMKLYLRKHALAAAVRKWGSVEGLQKEKDEREKKSLKRKLEGAESFLSSISSSRGSGETCSVKETQGAAKKQRQRTYMKNLVSKLRGDNK